MRRAVLVVGLAACSAPSAHPLANTPAATPSSIAWCLARQDEIFDGRGAPILCHHDDDTCVRYDVATGTAHAVPRPARVETTSIRDGVVCVAGACRALGPHVEAAIATARMDREDAVVEATRDLQAIVVGGKAWSLPADAPLKLPRTHAYAQRPSAMVTVTVMGNALLADWYDCAGPCHEALVATSTGSPTGVELDGYTTVFRASPTQFAVVSGTEVVGPGPDRVTLVDARTGAHRGAMDIHKSEDVRGVVVLDARSVVLLREAYEQDPVLQRLVAGRATTTEDLRIPACKSSD